MPLIMNGVNITQNDGDLKYNGVSLTSVVFNGVQVWYPKAPAGSQVFTASGTFIVPAGITQVTVCMCGGGGSGGSGQTSNQKGGGGFAGTIISQTITGLSGGQQVPVIIGAGGLGTKTASTVGGNAGGNTSFNGVVASGGTGAVNNVVSYAGRGNAKVSQCDGNTYYDGNTWLSYAQLGGGQAGAFGNGGQAREAYNSRGDAFSGGVGAGGGGITSSNGANSSGTGGRGQVVVSWS